MKTTVIGSGKDSATVNNSTTDKSAIRPALSLKDAAKVEKKDEPKTQEAGKAVANTSVAAHAENTKQEAPQTEQAKTEPTKAEIREQLKQEKPAFNLEKTIKLALDLNRRINQRGKLLETIQSLEAFEVAQQDDAEETDISFFQGCKLTIEDDNGREFTTKNPFIIKEVATRVNTLCVDKLAEIEGEIFIPA